MFDDEKKDSLENEDKEYETFGFDDDEENLSESYANRMLQKRRLERKQRKGSIWISRLFVLLRLLILTGLIYSLYFLAQAPQWYVDKDIFTVTNPHLEIVNNKIVPTYKILNELRKITVLNEPIYRFETDKIRLNLLELEPIEDIYIRRFWFPARLQIIVKERVPLISIYNNIEEPMIAFFTKDGVLIGDDYLPLSDDKKTIKVISSGSFRDWDKTKIDSIEAINDYIEQISNEKVEYMNLTNSNDVFVKLPNVVLRVGALDDGVYERISRITSVLPQLKQISKEIQYIDLRWKGSVYIKTN